MADSQPESFQRLIKRRIAKELDRVESEFSGASRGDIEAIHDARSGIRRLRVLLEYVPGKEPRRIRKRFGKLADRLGSVRDIDVVLKIFEEVPQSLLGDRQALVSLIETLEEDRARLLKKAERRLIAEKTSRLFSHLKEVIEAREPNGNSLNGAEGARSAVHIHIQNARNLADDRSEEALHRLRIECKKVRYLLEVAPGKSREFKGGARKMEAVQDALGAGRDLCRAIELVSNAPTLADLEVALRGQIVPDDELRRKAFEALESVERLVG